MSPPISLLLHKVLSRFSALLLSIVLSLSVLVGYPPTARAALWTTWNGAASTPLLAQAAEAPAIVEQAEETLETGAKKVEEGAKAAKAEAEKAAKAEAKAVKEKLKAEKKAAKQKLKEEEKAAKAEAKAAKEKMKAEAKTAKAEGTEEEDS